MPLQNNLDFGIGPKDATRWVLNVQPVIPFKLNEDWNLITRIITADWENARGEEWVVPLGAGFGKSARLERLPVNFQLGAYYNVETPCEGAEWQLRCQMQQLLPKPGK